MRLRNKLHHKGFLIGSLAVVALLGSAVGAIAFDYDHWRGFSVLGTADFCTIRQLLFAVFWWAFCLGGLSNWFVDYLGG